MAEKNYDWVKENRNQENISKELYKKLKENNENLINKQSS